MHRLSFLKASCCRHAGAKRSLTSFLNLSAVYEDRSNMMRSCRRRVVQCDAKLEVCFGARQSRQPWSQTKGGILHISEQFQLYRLRAFHWEYGIKEKYGVGGTIQNRIWIILYKDTCTVPNVTKLRRSCHYLLANLEEFERNRLLG